MTLVLHPHRTKILVSLLLPCFDLLATSGPRAVGDKLKLKRPITNIVIGRCCSTVQPVRLLQEQVQILLLGVTSSLYRKS